MDATQAAEFTTSIAGPGFAYDSGQVVSSGSVYGPREVPKDKYDAWLKAGILRSLKQSSKAEHAVAGHQR